MKFKSIAAILITIALVIVYSCKQDPIYEYEPTSVEYIDSIIVGEDIGNLLIKLKLLVPTNDSVVKVYYSTEDGTAIDGTDYTGIDDTIIFQRKDSVKYISIKVIPNANMDQDLDFFVNIKGATNAIVEQGQVRVKILDTDFSSEPVWQDEFDDPPLSTVNWNYGYDSSIVLGNKKLFYTNNLENVFIEDGCLNIKATENDTAYLSGMITTKAKYDFPYGKVEIRAKLAGGKGIHSALKMFGTNMDNAAIGWPKCGELDIAEKLGHDTSKVYATVHYEKSGHRYAGNSYTLSSGNFEDEFHVFTFIWTPSRLKWYVEIHVGNETKTVLYCELPRTSIPDFPFDLHQFFVFNVAVGGNWPGVPDATTDFPRTMVVDYVKVYR